MAKELTNRELRAKAHQWAAEHLADFDAGTAEAWLGNQASEEAVDTVMAEIAGIVEQLATKAARLSGKRVRVPRDC